MTLNNEKEKEQKPFKYIIEHMEGVISPWVEIEYLNMLNRVGDNSLILSAMAKEVIDGASEKLNRVIMTEKSIEDWSDADKSKVLLLDPHATQVLSPTDGDNYDFLLFGGILGDDPPKDRTGILRRMGFATRNLGPVQMTTDTAVVVSHEIVGMKRLMAEIEFIDRPDVELRKGESVMLPFRFIKKSDGKPDLAPGLIEHLIAQNDEPLDFEL